jgi:hypothetical protein
MLMVHRGANRKPLRAAFLAGSLVVATARSGSAAAAAPAQDFVVYLGMDIVTELPGTPSPVEPDGDGFVRVPYQGQMVRVTVEQAKLMTTMEPKLSRARASIEDLKGDRAYSLATDPQNAAMTQQMLVENVAAHDQNIIATNARSSAEKLQGIERAASIPNSGVGQADIDTARQEARIAENNLNTAFATPLYHSSLAGATHGQEAYDTFEVSFRLSTSENYDRAYGVLRMFVRDPTNPAQAAHTLKFFQLRELGPKPTKVTVRYRGLPPGFIMDSYSVHVYADGQELPSNLSRNRVDVTVDEAQQFLILRHLQDNRKGNTPAQVIAELRPARLTALIGGEQRAATVELAINRDGRVTEILPSIGIATALSPELETAVREVRFLPALVNGNPVDSQGTFALGEFVP